MADVATLQPRRRQGPPCPPHHRTSRQQEARRCQPLAEVPGGVGKVNPREEGLVPTYLPTGGGEARRVEGAAAEDMGGILIQQAPTGVVVQPL